MSQMEMPAKKTERLVVNEAMLALEDGVDKLLPIISLEDKIMLIAGLDLLKQKIQDAEPVSRVPIQSSK